ncbi:MULTISPECIES: Bug family tripartite tricarboxylate transporter substrate binding protein [Polaromonas]|uniref:Bug family tripartite tricarboxylate transporter substrate binding protein n=1 Tax=Polaromonas aquatica TaxID=332657 RepID=A0ABW1U7B2_9BURK
MTVFGKPLRARFAGAALLAIASAVPVLALAQSYPSRPIKMVVPFAAGGSVDVLGRVIADKVSLALGQPVVPDNRIGANGTIAHQMVASAPPDGYTIGMSGTSPLVLAPHQYKSLPYDSRRDFTYLACAGTTPFVLDVNPALPVKNVRELVAYAKANPGKLNFGSAGLGNSAHLSAELFKQVTGIDMVHVPYKGNALAMADLVSGQIQVLFDPVQTSLPQIRAGKVRPLAVTSKTRFAELPDLPTVAESGYPNYEFVVWYAFIAPAATPAPVVARLNSEINKVLRDPEVKARFAALGANLTESTPGECANFVRSEYAQWGKLFTDLGIRPE